MAGTVACCTDPGSSADGLGDAGGLNMTPTVSFSSTSSLVLRFLANCESYF